MGNNMVGECEISSCLSDFIIDNIDLASKLEEEQMAGFLRQVGKITVAVKEISKRARVPSFQKEFSTRM